MCGGLNRRAISGFWRIRSYRYGFKFLYEILEIPRSSATLIIPEEMPKRIPNTNISDFWIICLCSSPIAWKIESTPNPVLLAAAAAAVQLIPYSEYSSGCGGNTPMLSGYFCLHIFSFSALMMLFDSMKIIEKAHLRKR